MMNVSSLFIWFMKISNTISTLWLIIWIGDKKKIDFDKDEKVCKIFKWSDNN